MQLAREQFALIERLLPVQRGNVRIDKLTLLNAILYAAVNGCTWRGLPIKYGRWHTVFEELQMLHLHKVRIEVVSLDSTSIKVHPDGTGALEVGAPKASAAGRHPRADGRPDRAATKHSTTAPYHPRPTLALRPEPARRGATLHLSCAPRQRPSHSSRGNTRLRPKPATDTHQPSRL